MASADLVAEKKDGSEEEEGDSLALLTRVKEARVPQILGCRIFRFGRVSSSIESRSADESSSSFASIPISDDPLCMELTVKLHSSGCSGFHDHSMCDAHDHGGAHPLHTDEVISTQRSLENYQILTQCNIGLSKKWLSIGEYRSLALLTNDEHSGDSAAPTSDDLRLLYFSSDVLLSGLDEESKKDVLFSSDLEWRIRTKVKYRCEHRIGHLSSKIDEIESNWSNVCHCKMIDKYKGDSLSLNPASAVIVYTDSSIGCIRQYSALESHRSLISDHHFGGPSPSLFSIHHLAERSSAIIKSSSSSSSSEKSTMFYPSVAMDPPSGRLFIHDGFNDGSGVVSTIIERCIQGSDLKETKLPEMSVSRSRCQMEFLPSDGNGALLVIGGYVYDASEERASCLKSCELLLLQKDEYEYKVGSSSSWITDGISDMRSARCEHSSILIQDPSMPSDNALVFSVGGDNRGMFLRSAEFLELSLRTIGDCLSSFEKPKWKRTKSLKESCIRGSLVHTRRSDSADSSSGILYFVGGNNGLGSARNAQLYRIERNEWEQMKDTLFEHDDFPLLWIAQSDGLMRVSGHGGSLGAVEVFDHRDGCWHWDCQFPGTVDANDCDHSVTGRICRFWAM